MPECLLCDDTTWRSVEVDGAPRVTRCQCWHQRLYASLLKQARIPRRYAHCELSNFERHTDSQRSAHRQASSLVDRFPTEAERGLLLYGHHGVGKTHLAISLLKELIRRKGAHGVFYESRELLKLVRDTYSGGADETELEVLTPILEAEVLVLDDLGAEKRSEWVTETLGLVVNTRYSEKRVTIFTTNLLDDVDSTEPNSIAFQLGLRIRSRLLEMCDWIRMDGVDAREVGPHPTHEDISRWERSPANPKNRYRSALPSRTTGQARAQLRQRERDGKADLKWPGGRAGS